jgi:hypothetical protein
MIQNQELAPKIAEFEARELEGVRNPKLPNQTSHSSDITNITPIAQQSLDLPITEETENQPEPSASYTPITKLVTSKSFLEGKLSSTRKTVYKETTITHSQQSMTTTVTQTTDFHYSSQYFKHESNQSLENAARDVSEALTALLNGAITPVQYATCTKKFMETINQSNSDDILKSGLTAGILYRIAILQETRAFLEQEKLPQVVDADASVLNTLGSFQLQLLDLQPASDQYSSVLSIRDKNV